MFIFTVNYTVMYCKYSLAGHIPVSISTPALSVNIRTCSNCLSALLCTLSIYFFLLTVSFPILLVFWHSYVYVTILTTDFLSSIIHPGCYGTTHYSSIFAPCLTTSSILMFCVSPNGVLIVILLLLFISSSIFRSLFLYPNVLSSMRQSFNYNLSKHLTTSAKISMY